MRPIYESFRKAVLALDPCVSEEFLKKYVAYKAETNFVDIYPQSKKLVLVLNLRFCEINDPKKKCTDITGSRLNGHVQTSIRSLADMPYVIGLVRQSLELQLGDGGDA